MLAQGQKLEVVKRIGCPTCRHYAWHFSTMSPVLKDKKWHHPSCPIVSPKPNLVGKVLRSRRFF